MDQPSSSNKKFSPIEVKLEVGRQYYWCTCGRSDSQPFCDGSHSGSDFTPMAIKADEDKTAWLCTCKKTGNAPFCDGTHSRL